MSSGYIYILRNSSFSGGVLKIGIGKTTRSVECRAKKLSDKTGMPKAFSIAYSVKVPDCGKAEQKIHDELDRYRTNAILADDRQHAGHRYHRYPDQSFICR